jgi:hypothetical protein
MGNENHLGIQMKDCNDFLFVNFSSPHTKLEI